MNGKIAAAVLLVVICAALTLFAAKRQVDTALYFYVDFQLKSIARNPDAMIYSRASKYIERNRNAYDLIYVLGDIAAQSLETAHDL